MKKIIYIIFIFKFSFIVLAQERINEQLPNISPVAGFLSNSIGWTKNKSGQWISAKNKIPIDLGENQKILGNYEKYSIGEDNFISLEIRNVTINEINYILLIKKYKDGYYKYESIEKGWVYANSYKYYVLEVDEFAKIENIIHNSEQYLFMKVFLKGDVVFQNLKTLTTSSISKQINKELKNNSNYLNYMLALNINCNDEKKLVQYYFYEFSSELQNLATNKYYETTIENFNQFININ